MGFILNSRVTFFNATSVMRQVYQPSFVSAMSVALTTRGVGAFSSYVYSCDAKPKARPAGIGTDEATGQNSTEARATAVLASNKMKPGTVHLSTRLELVPFPLQLLAGLVAATDLVV